jgi:hypothetical protein
VCVCERERECVCVCVCVCEVKENGIGGACSTYGADEKCIQNFDRKT